MLDDDLRIAPSGWNALRATENSVERSRSTDCSVPPETRLVPDVPTMRTPPRESSITEPTRPETPYGASVMMSMTWPTAVDELPFNSDVTSSALLVTDQRYRELPGVESQGSLTPRR